MLVIAAYTKPSRLRQAPLKAESQSHRLTAGSSAEFGSRLHRREFVIATNYAFTAKRRTAADFDAARRKAQRVQ
jgi:hypothetical protein